MNCNNCGYKNEKNSNFCMNCGVKLENVQNIEEEQAKVNDVKQKVSVLSWIAFSLLLIGIFCSICRFNINISNKNILYYIINLPWIVTSLILAIISRVKNKDKMSIVIVIIDTIILAIRVICIIVLAILFVSVINACNDYVSENGSEINNTINGCRQMG